MEDQIRRAMAIYRPLLETAVRRFLDDPRNIPRLAGEPLTTGFCRVSAWATRHLLADAFPDVAWSISGGLLSNRWMDEETGTHLPGDPSLFPGGMQALNGRWGGSHFWVEGTLPDGRTVIVDGAADQFGWEDVLLTDVSDPRYRANVPGTHRDGRFLTDDERSFGWNVYLDWRRETSRDPEKVRSAVFAA